MILHKMNGEVINIEANEIHDIRSSSKKGCAVLILAHEFLPVREGIGQVRRIMQQEREAHQLKFSL